MPSLPDALTHWDADGIRPGLIVLACGVGTFALRWLPLRRALSARRSADPHGILGRMSTALGPAAIAALLVASAFPLLQAETPEPAADAVSSLPGMGLSGARMLAAGLACGAVVWTARRGRGIGTQTLAGTLTWGLCLAAARQLGAG